MKLDKKQDLNIPFQVKVKFLTRSLYSGERQWPFGPLVGDCLSIAFKIDQCKF